MKAQEEKITITLVRFRSRKDRMKIKKKDGETQCGERQRFRGSANGG